MEKKKAHTKRLGLVIEVPEWMAWGETPGSLAKILLNPRSVLKSRDGTIKVITAKWLKEY